MTLDNEYLLSPAALASCERPQTKSGAPVTTKRLERIVVLAVVLLLSVAFAGWYLKRGWIPLDDGTLAQSALRVTHGQLPHRDFLETYTGGLSYLNAAAFKLFGTNLLSMRIAALFFFIPWVAAVYYLALNFGSPIAAGLATLLAVSWSMPNYPTPMPSWYNLFFATFGAAALFRHLETGRPRWTFFAGLSGGLSILIKITGLYYIAAVLLYFIFREQELRFMNSGGESRRSILYKLFSVSSLLLFLGLLAFFLCGHLNSGSLYQFFVPSMVLVLLLLYREFSLAKTDSRDRFKNLFANLLPFGAGALAPVAAFVIPYAASQSLRSLYHGVFTMGMERANSIAIATPSGIASIVLAAPALIILLFGSEFRSRERIVAGVATAALGVVLLRYSGIHPSTKLLIFYSAVMFYPILIIIGAGKLAAKNSTDMNISRIVLLLALAATCGLVQFPFAAPIYFCYFAPLVMLAAFAVFSNTPRLISGIVLAFYLLFAVIRIAPSAIYYISFNSAPPMENLASARSGGIRVPHAEIYPLLVNTVQEHSQGQPILAFPECPEVYFLTGMGNPARNDAVFTSDEIRKYVKSGRIRLVVVNQSPYFASSRTSRETMLFLAQSFPNETEIGKYMVRWRP